MIEIGQHTTLTVIARGAQGYVLQGQGPEERLDLPAQEAPSTLKPGEQVRVFVYLDSDDVPVATTREPKVVVGQCAWLSVKEVNAVGAFVDWGLGKDLLVPFAEQGTPMRAGRSYLIYAYIDSTGRIAGTRRLDTYLSTDGSQFSAGDEVDLVLWERSDLGFKAVINHTHVGMLFEREILGELKPGESLRGYIQEVRPDTRINLSLQRHTASARDALQSAIFQDLQSRGGVSTLTDKSSPEAIFEAFGVSKKSYKKALGALYRARMIELEPGIVRLV
ncbi:GntR family transcriptional regulator [Lujinxingia litoralis]|uniref:GntR family transcriptional regulator n=1 Tax=Lujinxingia litoralis TaxID=2211119 RepID=A0A328CBX2_9DELT|nr:S1-like domain-containing RNA-binding protein [Lujinxingia litoralis]RAL23017.1 GntR family transcriptional regulator [Lujinxingia litoralis]